MSDICICAYVVPRLSLPPAGLIEICDINKNETSKWFFYCFQLQKEREKKEEEEKQQVNLENDARVFFPLMIVLVNSVSKFPIWSK